MKIYLFNPETRVYLGEDFADEAAMGQGGYVIPPDATTIEPPVIKRGQMLVFNSAEERWEVMEDSRNQQQHWQNRADGGLPDLYRPIR